MDELRGRMSLHQKCMIEVLIWKKIVLLKSLLKAGNVNILVVLQHKHFEGN